MSGYGGNPYAKSDGYEPYSGQGGGYGSQAPVQPYSPLTADNNYEMGSYGDQDFYDEVDQVAAAIRTVESKISQIEALHQRTLAEIDESNSAQTQHQLEAMVAETSALNNNLVARIKQLKGKYQRDQSKGPQVGVLDRNFKDALRKYQSIEKAFADRTREQMARQYRIVRPEATEEEVQKACEDAQGQQIFSNAVLNSSRRGEARSALREVQARHNEIQRIEKTIVELATLFNEMEQLVEQQEEMVEHIDQQGENIVHDVDGAQKELGGAVVNAAAARRKKWWCLLIVLLIIIVIVIIVVVVTLIKKQTNPPTNQA